ncbi:hypothetical protein QBC35DRAFT_551859 [Podospora australis]|uniref:Uncharacterized protein n=1 Tax=Podospora australis TaxID=1536484 RepID=A0AAN6WTR3_9PEZI|nr:hypothetical protein QBC35DRAFT_551859 [Podospora australis]
MQLTQTLALALLPILAKCNPIAAAAPGPEAAPTPAPAPVAAPEPGSSPVSSPLKLQARADKWCRVWTSGVACRHGAGTGYGSGPPDQPLRQLRGELQGLRGVDW